MDVDDDDDIISTSPESVFHGMSIRGQHLPPLPEVPGLVVQAPSIGEIAARTLQAQHVGSQRSLRLSRNTQQSRNVSLVNWISSSSGQQREQQTDQPAVVWNDETETIEIDDGSEEEIYDSSGEDVYEVSNSDLEDDDQIDAVGEGGRQSRLENPLSGPSTDQDTGHDPDSDTDNYTAPANDPRDVINIGSNRPLSPSDTIDIGSNRPSSPSDTIDIGSNRPSSQSDTINIGVNRTLSASGRIDIQTNRPPESLSGNGNPQGDLELSSNLTLVTSVSVPVSIVSFTSVSGLSSFVSISSAPVPVPSTSVSVSSTGVPISSSFVSVPNISVTTSGASSVSGSSSVSVQNISVLTSSSSAFVPASTSTSAPIPSSSVTDLASTHALASTASLEAESGPSSSQSPNVTRLVDHHNDSLSEFRCPKRKRIFSPEKPQKSAPAGSASASVPSEEEEEGDSCPICFEPWTTSGNHRLCSLKCGHLFGQSCIEKWLKGQGGKCPHCNAKAKRQDVRVLFAKTIKALDTSERDRALKDLEKERELRRKVEMETAQLRLQYQMSVEDTNKLRLEVEVLKSQLRKTGQAPVAGTSGPVKAESSSQSTQLSGQFVLEKTIKIFEGGNCRVMAYSNSIATLVVSQPSSSQLFPGFGIKKISAHDFKTSQYLTIHSKAIRDLAFHQTVEDGILLSCGLDKKVKMTSLTSNAVVQSYDTPMPGWSCAWNSSDCNYFYTGLQNGLVLLFDVRNTGEPVQEFNKEGSRSPVASLVYVSANQQREFRSSGLLIGQLDRVSFLENTPQGERIHMLPLEGSLTSLNVDQETGHMLASYRPTGRHPTIRHQLCELTSTNISTNPTVINNVCGCNVVHTFHGGRKQTVLSKTLIQKHPGDPNRLLVCGGDETSNSVHIWDSGTGQLKQRLQADGMVVDLCKFTLNNQQYLTALTDKQCKVYKWKGTH